MIVQLELGGWIKRNENGLYVLIEFIQGFLRYREELQKRRRTRSSVATRLQEARAIEIELRTARDAGELIEMSAAIALAQSIAGETRAVFGALPARFTRDLEMRAKLETMVNEGFNQIADKLEKEMAALACSDGVDLSSADE
jgi:phage terminase Nu1 subunit (DNA packaging protein)